jgi:hypothetical protein
MSPRRQTPAEELVQDLVRCAGFMEACLVLARRLEAPGTTDAATSLILWRNWLATIEVWVVDQ